MKKFFLVICKLLFFAAAVGLDPDVDKALDALLHFESILKGLHRCMCFATQDGQAAGQNTLLLGGRHNDSQNLTTVFTSAVLAEAS